MKQEPHLYFILASSNIKAIGARAAGAAGAGARHPNNLCDFDFVKYEKKGK